MLKVAVNIAFALLLAAAIVRADQVVVGPFSLTQGETIAVDPYNAGRTTASGQIELVDAATGDILDRIPVAIPGGLGRTIGFSQTRAFVGPYANPADSPAPERLVFARIEFASPDVLLGEPRSSEGTKTIIGGFKSMSGMDSETEVIELVSGPFLAAGSTAVHWGVAKGIGKMGKGVFTGVSFARVSDGRVVAAFQFSPESLSRTSEIQLPDAPETYVLQLTTSDPGLTASVALETHSGEVARYNFENCWPHK